MLNAETPRLKFALYGAHSSLGNALLCELLTRQHEAVALVDDLNSMTVRPGLRAKTGDLRHHRGEEPIVRGASARDQVPRVGRHEPTKGIADAETKVLEGAAH